MDAMFCQVQSQKLKVIDSRNIMSHTLKGMIFFPSNKLLTIYIFKYLVYPKYV